MDVSEYLSWFAQMLGTFISLALIPLIIYFYLRSRENKAEALRRDIVRIFANQIGEGRYISVFEIQSVIESEARTHGLRRSSVSQDEIMEDLVSDTVINPMLESQRKQEIVDNLREIHTNSALYQLLTRNRMHLKTFLGCMEAEAALSPEDRSLIKTLTETNLASNPERSARHTNNTATLFGVCGAIVTLLLFVIHVAVLKRFLASYEPLAVNHQLPVIITLGAVGALFTALAVHLISRSKRKRPNAPTAPEHSLE